MIISMDFGLPKIMHAIQPRFSGSSAASDEKATSTLTPTVGN